MKNNSIQQITFFEFLSKRIKLLDRINIYMPQYYPLPENWKNRGMIQIIFKPFWRNFIVLKKLPLWVGSKVRFNIYIEKEGDVRSVSPDAIHQTIDGVLIRKFEITEKNNDIDGVYISTEGNLKFSLGSGNYPEQNDTVIISANVQNFDRYWVGCAGLLVGGVVTFITTVAAGIVTGIFEVDKFWHIVNPFWK